MLGKIPRITFSSPSAATTISRAFDVSKIHVLSMVTSSNSEVTSSVDVQMENRGEITDKHYLMYAGDFYRIMSE